MHGNDCSQCPHALTVQFTAVTVGSGVGSGVGAAVVVRATGGVGPGVGLCVAHAMVLQTRDTIGVQIVLVGNWNAERAAPPIAGRGARHCLPPPQRALHGDHAASARRSSQPSSHGTMSTQFCGRQGGMRVRVSD